MSKKYKLIKEYPGNPLLVGDIVEEEVSYGTYTNEKLLMHEFLNAEDIENYPEFWEEVVEKKYTKEDIRIIIDKFEEYLREKFSFVNFDYAPYNRNKNWAIENILELF